MFGYYWAHRCQGSGSERSEVGAGVGCSAVSAVTQWWRSLRQEPSRWQYRGPVVFRAGDLAVR